MTFMPLMVSDRVVLISAIFILNMRNTFQAFPANMKDAINTTGMTVKDTSASFQLILIKTAVIPVRRNRSLKTKTITDVNNSCMF